MSAANARLQIAEAHLAVLGPFEPGERAEVTEKRAEYERRRRIALEQISEAQRTNLPYRDE